MSKVDAFKADIGKYLQQNHGLSPESLLRPEDGAVDE
jgi:hypothetical protein